MSDRMDDVLSNHTAAVLPEEIIRQRKLGWPDFHPEDFCHRCGRRNPVWWTPGALWNLATADRERGYLDILCPSCFVELHEQATGTSRMWALTPEPPETTDARRNT